MVVGVVGMLLVVEAIPALHNAKEYSSTNGHTKKTKHVLLMVVLPFAKRRFMMKNSDFIRFLLAFRNGTSCYPVQTRVV